MEISPAALPPVHGAIPPADREHPSFSAYQAYRDACAAQLVEALSFQDWLSTTARARAEDAAREHPAYPAFQEWMIETKAGARRCPGDRTFPENFAYWRNGGRW